MWCGYGGASCRDLMERHRTGPAGRLVRSEPDAQPQRLVTHRRCRVAGSVASVLTLLARLGGLSGWDMATSSVRGWSGQALSRRRTQWQGGPIRLFSCDTGKNSNGFAQQLSDQLGVPVTAPTTPVSTVHSSVGQAVKPIVSDLERVYDPTTATFVVRPVDPPNGEWKTYLPSTPAI